ncbi:unnamed protein product [Effrenium voratum]|uniref:C3H1-type domain-containing protein n=1 Tax=Effrenium voratum TaxID=2562239 RepID=A0AA36MQU7_9DINO|nr:unnamed protein product [Effrenium voratum]CAJ1431105.1 unnamed protein product [Effrenium voratum]
MALNSIIATMEGPDHELWAVVIRNGSVEVEPWASLATLAADSPAAGALGRSASSPVLTTWEKPWEEPLGLALHRNGRCLPCLFFRRKGDGCRKGDQCDRCHICTLQEMKRRKLKLQRQARAQAARAAARRGPQAGPTPLRAEP